MTIPTDLLARLRAVLTAAEAMTPGPWLTESGPRLRGAISTEIGGLPRQVANADGQAPQFEDPRIVPDPADRQHANAVGIVALRNATADIASLLTLVEAPAPLTVGAALADPRVQDGSHVVEYSGKHDVAEYRQTRVDAGGFRIWSRWRLADRWGPWRDNGNTALDGCDVRKPCRLVPLTDADRDPATRGPL